ncbi:Ribose import ATP-binding protein RbsA [compost metagenome]
MDEIILRMAGIDKFFPGVHALNQCQFELKRGEVHALVGENGAGKSTLMKIATGVYTKDAGQMWYKGSEVDIPNTRTAQELGISIIHQELNLMPHLTVAQNIFMGREPRKALKWFVDDLALNRKVQELFDQMNLKLDPKALVSDLTVANQQMVEIAKALSFHAEVLIMDEPTAALTDTEINELFRMIEQLRQEGVGVIYISHRMDELKRITDRITVMRDGCYVDTVRTDSVTIDQIISMMVGRELYQTSKPTISKQTQQVVLEVRNLCSGQLLKDISFHLNKGEILGFAGLMGAGRTEVVRAVFGADPIDKGEIKLHGNTVRIRHPHQAVQQGIGYLSEDRKRYGLLVEMDISMNNAMASFYKFRNAFGWMRDREMRKSAEQHAEALATKTPSISQKVKFLSGGNQQKVVIGKWLTRDCDVLIFDEPTRGIDVGAKSEIYKLLEQLASEGKAIIIVSSDLPEILRMSHRIIVMCEGRITGELLAEEASQEAIMKYATMRS